MEKEEIEEEDEEEEEEEEEEELTKPLQLIKVWEFELNQSRHGNG